MATIKGRFIKAKWYDFDKKEFIPENMKPRTLKTYENHLVKMRIIHHCIDVINNNAASHEEHDNAYRILVSMLHFTHHVDTKKRGSKLAGLTSISTSALYNDFCIARRIEALEHPEINSICRWCYAITQQLQQIGVMLCGIRNMEILSNVLIPVEYFKLADVGIDENQRIEAFGDVGTVIQARNYIRLVKAWTEKHFAAWSKNGAFWEKAFDIEGKPENMTFIISSKIVNVACKISEGLKKYVDHRFTVYTKEYAKLHGIIINCGGRKCLTCLICYRKNNIFDICELKK